MSVLGVYILGLRVHRPCCVSQRLLWVQGIKGVTGDLRRSKIRITRGGDQGRSQGGSKGSVIRVGGDLGKIQGRSMRSRDDVG